MIKEIILILTMLIVTLCTYISYIPQLLKLLKTKKSEDLSVASWVLWSVSSLADLIYSITLGRIELIIASISEFILILATLILTIYYEQQKSHAKNNEKKLK
uniref:SemiSWEET, PQLC, membrane protein, sugar n=1 Tax=Myoviridae sp. ctrf010 TaxID=2825182 RepID=A0A8S5P1N9_9CAUD|nr:MAG TPA: SemiSWEET, PQLC, membrane protein, sugar [Myoviridae sp. ctrf010]